MARYWYYLGIVGMFLLGWVHPSLGLWLKSVGVTPYLVGAAFFLNGFALSPASLLGSLRQWRILCLALLTTFVGSPALVWAARHLLPGGDGLIAQGFQLVSLVPTLFVSAVVLTRLAKGNAAVALYLTVASNLLAIVTAPALVLLTLGTSGLSLNLTGTAVSMVFTVLLPTLAGQFARVRWKAWAERHAGLITVASQCTILAFIVTGVSALPRSVLSPSVVLYALAGGVALHLALIGLGRLGAQLIHAAEPDRRALIFCSAEKSFVFDVLLCERLFAGDSTSFGLVLLPGIVYYLLELTIDSFLAQWWGRVHAT